MTAWHEAMTAAGELAKACPGWRVRAARRIGEPGLEAVRDSDGVSFIGTVDEVRKALAPGSGDGGAGKTP